MSIPVAKSLSFISSDFENKRWSEWLENTCEISQSFWWCACVIDEILARRWNANLFKWSVEKATAYILFWGEQRRIKIPEFYGLNLSTLYLTKKQNLVHSLCYLFPVHENLLTTSSNISLMYEEIRSNEWKIPFWHNKCNIGFIKVNLVGSQPDLSEFDFIDFKVNSSVTECSSDNRKMNEVILNCLDINRAAIRSTAIRPMI